MFVYWQNRQLGFSFVWTSWHSKTTAVAAGGLFMKYPNLNGISVGGPFFANPIG